MKLTPAQQRVVDAMREGYKVNIREVRYSGESGAWLWHGHRRYARVQIKVARALKHKGVIVPDGDPQLFSLADAWKEANP